VVVVAEGNACGCCSLHTANRGKQETPMHKLDLSKVSREGVLGGGGGGRGGGGVVL